MPRSPAGIQIEAATIGKHANDRTLPDNELIQILCALVEELAANARTLQDEVDSLKKRASHA